MFLMILKLSSCMQSSWRSDEPGGFGTVKEVCVHSIIVVNLLRKYMLARNMLVMRLSLGCNIVDWHVTIFRDLSVAGE